MVAPITSLCAQSFTRFIKQVLGGKLLGGFHADSLALCQGGPVLANASPPDSQVWNPVPGCGFSVRPVIKVCLLWILLMRYILSVEILESFKCISRLLIPVVLSHSDLPLVSPVHALCFLCILQFSRQ